MGEDLKKQRDAWLKMSDEELFRSCRMENFRASGNGGQKVNKTSSGARVIHIPSGLSASSIESRSQHDNRREALKKLRMQIAFEIRQAEGLTLPPDIPALKNPLYPLWIATLLDILKIYDYSPKDAAPACGQSTSKILKILARDSRLWQHFCSERDKLGLPRLRPPE